MSHQICRSRRRTRDGHTFLVPVRGVIGSALFAAVLISQANAVIVVGNRDTWIQSDSPDANFEASANPSTQLRNASAVTQASLYSFTLPALGAGNQITSVGFDVNVVGNGTQAWTAEFALLASNPDLTTITWNSAVADGFITGADGDNNPILGGNAAAAGESWVVNQSFLDGDELLYTSNGGLTALLNSVASPINPVDVTLLVFTQGTGESDSGRFYGMEDGESSEFEPNPRLHYDIEPVPEPTGWGLLLAASTGAWRLRRRTPKSRCL